MLEGVCMHDSPTPRRGVLFLAALLFAALGTALSRPARAELREVSQVVAGME